MADCILSNGTKDYIDFASEACYQIHRAESLAAGALGMFQQGPATNTTQHT